MKRATEDIPTTMIKFNKKLIILIIAIVLLVLCFTQLKFDFQTYNDVIETDDIKTNIYPPIGDEKLLGKFTQIQKFLKFLSKSKINVDDNGTEVFELNDLEIYDFENLKYIVQNLKKLKNNVKVVSEKPKCDYISKKLVGYQPYDEEELERDLTDKELYDILSKQNISLGGKWSPPYCEPKHHIAIVIPYRDREQHLKQFLRYMHPLFARQELSYGIYLIEPVQNITFNRGLLMNIGFVESNKDANDLWNCHSFHDIDLISEDDRLLYHCPDNPMHLSYRITKMQFFVRIFGGATILSKEKFLKSNGYSNLYFGWGGEDDDYFRRLASINYYPTFQPEPYGQYSMLGHVKDVPNPHRFLLLENSNQRFNKEGLNTLKYKVIKKIVRKYYTKVIVHYDKAELIKNMTDIYSIKLNTTETTPKTTTTTTTSKPNNQNSSTNQ